MKIETNKDTKLEFFDISNKAKEFTLKNFSNIDYKFLVRYISFDDRDCNYIKIKLFDDFDGTITINVFNRYYDVNVTTKFDIDNYYNLSLEREIPEKIRNMINLGIFNNKKQNRYRESLFA